jgi:hypothetical protein
MPARALRGRPSYCRRRRAAWSVLIVVSAVGCELYDPSLLDEQAAARDGGQQPMDGGPDARARDGDPSAGDDGGDDDACVASEEICNAVDDDCDQEIDERTQVYCEQQLPNARAVCGNNGTCLNLGCYDGFISCDGDPSDGCEPVCLCRPCPDAGTEDGG